MTATSFRIGAVFPQTEIGEDPGVIRAFAETIEGLGYSHLVAYDHVLGAGRTTRPDWRGPYDLDSTFHEPLVLFSHLAALTRRLEFMTGVIIMPQRQTALFAKQAATLDLLAGGRLRLGLGVGWNEVEYEALGVPFEARGARLDEQIAVLRRLWSERAVTLKEKYHAVTDAGLWPLPKQRPIPIWVGGFIKAAMLRAVHLGDGWLPATTARKATEMVTEFQDAVRAAGRDPGKVGLENIIQIAPYTGGAPSSFEDTVAAVGIWRRAGASGVAIDTMRQGLTPDQHLALFHRIAGELGLKAP